MLKKGFFLGVLFCAAAALSAQPVLTPDVLVRDRWHNDEFSFDFAREGDVVSFYTFGRQTGTLRGRWRIEGGRQIVLSELSVSPGYNQGLIMNDIIQLTYSFSFSDPKAARVLSGGPQGLFKVWDRSSFRPTGLGLTLQPGNTAAVTTGYQLTATTENLRLRQGPGTNYEQQIYTYMDAATNTVKTWTSVLAGTNLRILARTREQFRVADWNNHWYYVEYKEPLEGLIVYRNAWMFGEFLTVNTDSARWVRIDKPVNEESSYNDYQTTIEGAAGGRPVALKIQIKNAYGNVIKEIPITGFDRENPTFSYVLSKRTEDLFIGSNTVNVVAQYENAAPANRQVTFYIHESVGEMAKPVIYLYPTAETNVSVRVRPQRGFSVTEPEYGNGWEVTARPDGTIVNRADGKTYPYLFWESNGQERPATREGFVVRQADLEAFFRDKLAVLGLNQKETGDFLEFWIPVLNEGPYYYISFVDRETQDRQAPLSVTPAPDSVIRVFFDSMPLRQPITVREQRLEPQARRGFAVVEWGGMRYNGPARP